MGWPGASFSSTNRPVFHPFPAGFLRTLLFVLTTLGRMAPFRFHVADVPATARICPPCFPKDELGLEINPVKGIHATALYFLSRAHPAHTLEQQHHAQCGFFHQP